MKNDDISVTSYGKVNVTTPDLKIGMGEVYVFAVPSFFTHHPTFFPALPTTTCHQWNGNTYHYLNFLNFEK